MNRPPPAIDNILSEQEQKTRELH